MTNQSRHIYPNDDVLMDDPSSFKKEKTNTPKRTRSAICSHSYYVQRRYVPYTHG